MPRYQLQEPATDYCLFYNSGDPCFVDSRRSGSGLAVYDIKYDDPDLYSYICNVKQQKNISVDKFVCRKHIQRLEAQYQRINRSISLPAQVTDPVKIERHPRPQSSSVGRSIEIERTSENANHWDRRSSPSDAVSRSLYRKDAIITWKLSGGAEYKTIDVDVYQETIGDLKKHIIAIWSLDDVTIEQLALYRFDNLTHRRSLIHAPDDSRLKIIYNNRFLSVYFDVKRKPNAYNKLDMVSKPPQPNANDLAKVNVADPISPPGKPANRLSQASNVTSSYHEIPPGLCGLDNSGNTCYMNSALQCLSNIQPLTNFFIHEQIWKFVNSNNPAGTGGCAASAYSSLIQEMWSAKLEKCTPTMLKEAIDRYTTQFTAYEQHDSQEFMGFLLDALHEDLLNSQTRSSPISDLFQGQLESSVRCWKCDTDVKTVSAFNFLSLPIISSKSRTNLSECMEEFLKPETIGTHGKWYCNICHQQTDARKYKKIKSLPPVLILQLRRFDIFPGRQINNKKIRTIVDYPVQNLSPHDLALNSSSTTRYDLVAISIHRGATLQSGHYLTIAMNHTNKLWYEFDDSFVTSANPKDITNQDAYILCYVRKGLTRISVKTS
ncbi:unnamed protein product [Adineta ricciae]|uniref:Ubiquitin carboxyl-terminal hydrolase n=1 Tax=Adineta ricciae TaxID=249248 RepID=A0A815NI36_ADIRI|nr:unnamed protein product [Adineta ricciae]CAF1438548.1 unnamed protein product [Adineta ricciae]